VNKLDRTAQIEDIWRRYVNAHEQEIQAQRDMFMKLTPLERQRMIEIGFTKGNVYSALTLLKLMATSGHIDEVELHAINLFDILTYSMHRFRYLADEIFEELDKGWLKENIEHLCEIFLEKEPDEYYATLRSTLYLYHEVDPELAHKLALRAAQSDDYDTRDVSITYLESHPTAPEDTSE
jgi:hypothetical protein